MENKKHSNCGFFGTLHRPPFSSDEFCFYCDYHHKEISEDEMDVESCENWIEPQEYD